MASWDDPGDDPGDDPQGLGGLTTEGRNLSDLENNVREAVAIHFEPDELPKRVRLGRRNICALR
jgi:hypothetical protein